MKLPSLFSVGMQIIALIRQMKGNTFVGDLEIIGQILMLILGLIATDKLRAANAFNELHNLLSNPLLTGGTGALQNLKNKIQAQVDGTDGPAPDISQPVMNEPEA